MTNKELNQAIEDVLAIVELMYDSPPVDDDSDDDEQTRYLDRELDREDFHSDEGISSADDEPYFPDV